MLFEDYMDYMFCYTVNKFFNFSKKCLKKHLQFVMQLIIEENDLIFCYLIKYRVPTRTGKPRKMERHFAVREKSGNFEQTGKVREYHAKYWNLR